MKKTLATTIILGLLLSPMGCDPRTKSESNPFRDTESEYILAVVLDMSGSFDENMLGDDPRAYRHLLRLVERFFRQRMGSDDRVLLTRLGGGEDTLLWDGPVSALRREFPDAKSFSDFLRNKSGGGSNVYAAVADTLEYLAARPGITEETRLLTVVLSDLLDNDPDADIAKPRLEQALDHYATRGGYLTMQWVHQTAVPEWTQLLTDHGFPNTVWNGIVVDPPLPNFDD